MSAAHTHCLVFYFFLLITSWRPFLIYPNRGVASFATCASYLVVGASYTVPNWSSADEHWRGARFWLLQCCKEYLGANVSLYHGYRGTQKQPVFTPRLYYLLAVPLSELLNLRDWVFSSEIWGKSGLWYIHNGMLFGFKRNEVLTHATIWMNLTDIIKVKEAWRKSHTAWWGP